MNSQSLSNESRKAMLLQKVQIIDGSDGVVIAFRLLEETPIDSPDFNEREFLLKVAKECSDNSITVCG
jgi:hypothetical protein